MLSSIRYGRRRAIVCFVGIIGAIAKLLAFTVDADPRMLLALLLLYSLAIPADSGALTSGMSASAQPQYRGATMALHSTVGFGLSAAGGWAVGIALDMGGGMTAASGWFVAFLVMSVGGLTGPIALWWSSRRRSRAPISREEQSVRAHRALLYTTIQEM
jgi:MFS family permease